MTTIGTCLALLLACTAYTYLVCDGARSWIQRRSFVGYKLAAGSSGYARSKQDCVFRCVRQYATCTAASYYEVSGLCIKTNTPRPQLAKSAATMTLMTNIQNLDALYVANVNLLEENAIFTLGEAAARCQGLNARLMNQTEYLHLYNAGHNLCDCGWLAEGVIMYANQGPNTTDWLGACTSQEPGIGECSNASLASAWCVPGQ